MLCNYQRIIFNFSKGICFQQELGNFISEIQCNYKYLVRITKKKDKLFHNTDF